jgi:PST family polysaccharide transporter
MSIVYANIVQATVVTAILIRAAGIRSWATPSRLKLSRIRDLLRYGAPLALQGIAHNASRYWDNLAVMKLFGDSATGVYNMAYNLADIPAIQVGEQLATVLMPSMSALPEDRRAEALERSSAILSLIIFPMAVGLGLVSTPLIAVILPADRWQEVGPLLLVLAGLSVFRPIMWVLSAYMEVQARTARLMYLELAKIVVLLGGFILLAPFGLRVAAAAVGIAFGATSVAGVLMVAREGPSIWRLFLGFAQPLAACAVMAVAVIATDRGLRLAGVDAPAIHLAVEIAVGAGAYAIGALTICRTASRDLIKQLRGALRKDSE